MADFNFFFQQINLSSDSQKCETTLAAAEQLLEMLQPFIDECRKLRKIRVFVWRNLEQVDPAEWRKSIRKCVKNREWPENIQFDIKITDKIDDQFLPD